MRHKLKDRDTKGSILRYIHDSYLSGKLMRASYPSFYFPIHFLSGRRTCDEYNRIQHQTETTTSVIVCCCCCCCSINELRGKMHGVYLKIFLLVIKLHVKTYYFSLMFPNFHCYLIIFLV